MQYFAQEFTSYMDDNDIQYTTMDDENVIQVVYGGDNLETISIFVIFDEDGDPFVQFKCWEILNFNDKEEIAYEMCNRLNAEYRWVKFYLDKDGDVNAAIDAVISEDDCGEACMNLVHRIIRIVDDAYPEIAKTRWA